MPSPLLRPSPPGRSPRGGRPHRCGVRLGASAGALAVAVAVSATGCSTGLSSRTLTVIFKDGTSQATLDAASAACAHVVPGISPAPTPTVPANSDAAGLAGNSNEVRFRVGGADDHDLALLTDCLQKQRGVLGVQPPNDDFS